MWSRTSQTQLTRRTPEAVLHPPASLSPTPAGTQEAGEAEAHTLNVEAVALRPEAAAVEMMDLGAPTAGVAAGVAKEKAEEKGGGQTAAPPMTMIGPMTGMTTTTSPQVEVVVAAAQVRRIPCWRSWRG